MRCLTIDKGEYFIMGFFGLAGTASQIIANTLEALKSVRERAQSSKDNDLKERISGLYDNVLELKEVILQLTEENLDQKRQIEALQRAREAPQPVLRQVGSCNFYFVGEEGPYCQPCYDGKHTLTKLSPPENWNRGVRRHCVLCHAHFYEQSMKFHPS